MAPEAVGDVEQALERRGLQLCMLNTILGSALGVFSKLATHDGIPFFQLVLVRAVALVAGTIPGLVSLRLNPFRHQDRQWLLILRGIFGFLSITTWYWALALLPMSDVNALSFLTPSFVALLAPHLLKEPTPKSIYASMPLSILGVLFVAQPGVIFGSGRPANSSALGVAVATAQALFSAGSNLTVRALAADKQPVPDILFSFGFISLLGSGIMCGTMPHAFVVPFQARTYLYILAACLLGYIVQHIFTSALQNAKAAPAAALDLLSMTWGLLADYQVFRRPPSLLSLVGAVIIWVSSLIPLLWASGDNASSQQAVLKGADGASLREVPDTPIKVSGTAEPEVQLAKISKYLGKAHSTSRCEAAASSEGDEAVGLVSKEPCSSSGGGGGLAAGVEGR